MDYVKDLYRDEIRAGFLVTSNTKKIWNRQLEIWAEVDRICRKHGINYQAAYGTLLGAARHGGFIPWDDDFDICIRRPDYNRFTQVLDGELGDDFEIKHKTFAVTKIVHKHTTSIYSLDDRALDRPQGIMIDIFAFDIAPDGTKNSLLAFNAIQELLTAVFENLSELPKLKHLQDGGQLVVELEVLEQIAALPFTDKLAELYRYVDALSGQSSAVGFFQDVLDDFYPPSPTHTYIQNHWLDKTIYLPFETVELPAPKMFDEVLTACYGDWRTPVRDGKNRSGFFCSADIPWREFLRQINK